MDNIYRVVNCQLGYATELSLARKLTEEEQTHYSAEWRDRLFQAVPSGQRLSLSHVDLPAVSDLLCGRPDDGAFVSGGGQLYIISDEEWSRLAAMEQEAVAAQEAKERSEKRSRLLQRKEAAERQMKNGKLPSAAECKALADSWNNLQNEGGEGYLPHYYSDEEYHRILADLENA